MKDLVDWETAVRLATLAAPAGPRATGASRRAVVALLRRPEGATAAQIMEATGWQAHSVRGAIAGSIKKKLGFAVSSEKSEAGRVYRIVKGAGA